MTKYSYIGDRKWTMKDMSTAPINVPESPGIYVIGHVKSFEGLERKREYVYIGRSKNVRKRIQDHNPKDGKNRKLRAYLQENIGIARYWYLTGMSQADAKALEKMLIKEFSPIFNTQHNR